jgi:uncharacterized protein YbjT (DUF2867 family)
MVLVIGATGKTGRDVALQLAGAGARVCALVRTPEKAADLSAAGLEVVQGDLDAAPSLDAALRGVERVYIATSSDQRMAEVQIAAIRAAERAGVKHMVKLSAVGAGPDSPALLSRLNDQAEQALRESTIGWTILQANFFMQNFLQYGPSIVRDGVVRAPVGEGRAGQVDSQDVAAVAAAALTEPGHEGRTYVVTGPEALSYQDCVRHISAATGREVRYVDITPEAALKGLTAAGVRSGSPGTWWR